MPLISVIVPSYNHGHYVEAAIRSALNQEDADLEVILVDDRSTDETYTIAQRIAREDPRLKVLQNEQNSGTYATQNRALDEATGEFVAVLNSDDLWRPGKLAAQVELMRSHPDAMLCYTLGAQIDENDVVLEIDQHLHWPRTERHDLLPLLLSSNRLLASSVMFRRGAVRFEPSLRYSGDWIAWLKLAEAGDALCVPEHLTLWRQHGTNSYTRSKAVTLEEIRVRRAILKNRKRWLDSAIRKAGDGSALAATRAGVRRGLSECAVDLTALYVLTGHMALAKAAAAQAVKLSPASSSAHRRLALALMPSVMARKRLWGGDQIRLTRKELKSLDPLDV